MSGDYATAGIADYTFSNTADGNHTINVNCTDSSGNNKTSDVSFTVDTVYPIVKLLSPANGTTETSSSTVTFSYNVTDVAIDNCSLIIDNAVSSTDTTITVNISQSISKSLSNGDYNWSINCTDKAGNTNASNETRRITVSYSAPSTDGGGGSSGSSGGGGGAGISAITNLDLKPTFTTVGYTAKQTQKDKATFTIAGTKYTAELAKLTSGSVTINIAGASSVFKPGDTKEFDVNNDGSKDISVTLSKITGGRAEIIYKMLAKPKEPAIEEEIVEKEEEKVEEKPIMEVGGKEKSKGWIDLLIIGLIMIISLIGYFYIKKKRQEK